MKLRLARSYFTEVSTIGELYAGGQFICYTLEDRVRREKVPGLTAIPEGTYKVEITWSAKFSQPMPILLDVPNFAGIRIHWGNTAEDTAGCLLVGLERQQDRILRSREAYAKVYSLIARSGGATIQIEDNVNKAKSAAVAALALAIATAALWERGQR